MPIIEYYSPSDYGAATQAAFEGQTSFEAVHSFTLILGVKFRCKTDLTALLSFLSPSSAEFDGSTSLSALAHLDGEPNLFPMVDCAIEVDLTPTVALGQVPFVNCQIEIDLLANPGNPVPETYAVDIIVDIMPPADTGQYQEYVSELMINGTTVVPIKSYTYSESKSNIGNSLEIELADVSMIPVLESANEFRFRIGKIVNGVTTWKTYIDRGIVNNSNYSLSRQLNAPFTTYSFTNESALQVRLGRAPVRDLVIYDPYTAQVHQEDFEILNDVSGHPILVELFPINGLKLHSVFNEIFVHRCGFSGFVTNLPDYPLKRIDFSMTEPYLSELASIIGMFEPLIFEYQDKVWVIDTTAALPPGFPVSTEVTVSQSTLLQVSRQPERLDGYVVVYAEDGRFFDFYTVRTETTFQETGSVALGNYTKTEITRTINEYRTFANPSVIIRSEIVRDRRETSNYHGQTIGRTLEEYTYDYFGRQTVSEKTQSAYLPQLTGGTRAITDIHQERVEIRYGADPFQPSRQIQQQIWTDIRGLIAVDASNRQLEEPFKQDYMVAYQSGNLNSGMTTEFGLIKTIRETLFPLTKGQFQIETIVHDYLLQTVTREITEPRNGDFSTSGLVSRQRRVFLPYLDGSPDGVNAKIKNLYLGELPITYGLALATRLLNRANRAVTTTKAESIGVDFYLRRGIPVSLKNLDNDLLANCLVDGFQIKGSYKSVTTSIDGLKI